MQLALSLIFISTANSRCQERRVMMLVAEEDRKQVPAGETRELAEE